MSLKIAYLMPPTLMGRQNGVVSQALTWRDCLAKIGTKVDLLTPWETYEWDSYDAIHAFGIGHYLGMIPLLRARGAKKIVLSPIYDSNRGNFLASAISHLSLPIGEMRTTMATMRATLPYIDTILVRSDFEARKISSIFTIGQEKIVKVPLPVRFAPEELCQGVTKDPICSHVSILSASIKNVDRLIQAAIKYQFPLHLAGRIGEEGFRKRLDSITRAHKNVVYEGHLSEENLKKLYARSRVFALPSLMEGVGLVALEAAAHGADIVITERGGPKEYYGSLARTVDPENIDDVGTSVMGFLEGKTFQPALSERILNNFSLNATAERLLRVYRNEAERPDVPQIGTQSL